MKNECASGWCPNKPSITPLINGYCDNCVKICDSCKILYHKCWMSVADDKICRFCATKQRLQKEKTLRDKLVPKEKVVDTSTHCDILMKRGSRKGEACSRKLTSQGKCSYHK